MRLSRTLVLLFLIPALAAPAPLAAQAARKPAPVRQAQKPAPAKPAPAPAKPVAIAPRPGAPASFADLTARLLPTVVNIATTQTLKPSPGQRGPGLPPGSPLADLFKDFLGAKPAEPRHVTAVGSGFIIDASGLIVTNNHVIDNSDQITVILNDGSSLPAKLVGRDDKTDLALLKVTPKKPLPAAHFGDSDRARIGDWVIAIGNPFGIGSTVTAGIVSARNREINEGPYDDFIQTDAPINRGNSGGPLFDMDGNVVGVNSAIYSPSGGSVGIGFSIPSNLARQVIGQLRQYGQARRGWVGVRIQGVTADLAQSLGLPTTQGALVTDVTGGGPAARAGMQKGDLVTGFDGRPVPDNRMLPRFVADTPVGKTVNVDVLRKGRKQTLRLTVLRLAETAPARPAAQPQRPPPQQPRDPAARLGLSLAVLDPAARQRLRVPGGVDGVLVTAVAPDSTAADKNIRPGDIIIEVQNQKVRTPADVNARLAADARTGRPFEAMLVGRGGDLIYVALKLN